MPEHKNENCLEGMRCPNPECESLGPFLIAATTLLKVSDDGTEDEGHSVDWEDDSYCECKECGREGKVLDFKDASSLDQVIKSFPSKFRIHHLPRQDYYFRIDRAESFVDTDAGTARLFLEFVIDGSEDVSPELLRQLIKPEKKSEDDNGN